MYSKIICSLNKNAYAYDQFKPIKLEFLGVGFRISIFNNFLDNYNAQQEIKILKLNLISDGKILGSYYI